MCKYKPSFQGLEGLPGVPGLQGRVGVPGMKVSTLHHCLVALLYGCALIGKFRGSW